jgi:aspartyl-tRNA(Asn)/glutamyl-tRNA(Gln) amidotransferase subunit A
MEPQSIADAHGLVLTGQLSPVDLVERCLRRIERLDARLNAFITVTAARALVDARKAADEIREGRRSGPLCGIPVGLKDMYETAGVRTTAGSRLYADRVPGCNAEAVELLKEAGAIIIGKLNMDEFAYGAANLSSAFGPVRNPWDTALVAGGSSGGSAAAVAAGECLAALGSDTGGSVRIPASFCGVVGLKPTFGLIDTRGIVPLAPSLDHCGTLTRTARDAALLLNVLVQSGGQRALRRGTPETDFTSRLESDLNGVVIGLPRDHFYQELDLGVQSAVENALHVLRGLGAVITEVDIPDLEWAETAFRVTILKEALPYHLPLLREKAGDYQESVRLRLETGLSLTVEHYEKAQQLRARLSARVAEAMRRCDVLVTPTTSVTAFPIEDGGGSLAISRLLARCTSPFNLTGQPAISLPCGFDERGMPVGLQIAGRPFGETTVLQVAHQYQLATEWHLRWPPLD